MHRRCQKWFIFNYDFTLDLRKRLKKSQIVPNIVQQLIFQRGSPVTTGRITTDFTTGTVEIGTIS